MASRKRFALSLSLIAAWTCAGCSSLTIDADYDEAADFSKYATYAWMAPPDPGEDPLVNDDLTTRRIRESVDRYIGARGLTPADAADADLLLQHHVALRNRVDVWDDYGYRTGRGWARPSVDVHQYTEGTLVLDFVDRESKELVWRGSATGVVSKKRSNSAGKIDEAAQLILERYPPR